MNICILTHTFPKYPNDTTAAFMHTLASGLMRLGHTVFVVTPFHPDLQPNAFEYRVLPYRYIWPDRFHVLGYSQTLQRGTRLPLVAYFFAPLLLVFGVWRLMRLLTSESVDLISVHWIIPGGIIAAFVTRFINIPFTVTLAGSDVFIARKNSVFAALARFVAKYADVICADSPEYLRELSSVGAQFQKSKVIPYPVESKEIRFDQDMALRIRRELGLRRKTNVLLSVGRLIEKKGFPYAIDAMPKILKKYPDTVYLIVGDGDIGRQLKEHAQSVGIDYHARFIGSVTRDTIAGYYSLADIVIVPSIHDREGNLDDRPVALIEAMSCSRPVIASRFPGNSLTIVSGSSGMLVPEKDSNAIAYAAISLLGNITRRRAMGKHARDRIVKHFDSLSIGRTYADLFRAIRKRRYG